MQEPQLKKFNLPYQQYAGYFLVLFCKKGTFPTNISAALQGIGYSKTAAGISVCRTNQDWSGVWEKTYNILQAAQFTNEVTATITADESLIDSASDSKDIATIQEIAQSLWLGDALREDRVMCYYQPIVNASSSKDNLKIFGYESFVRARSNDGKIIGGNVVVQASKSLNIEYMVDRLLHVQAIKTFAASHNTGFLFINFFTGFIQRPEIYLEGLRETAKLFGIVPKNLVLEFASCDLSHDIKHLKNVCDYAKLQGYSVALDDVTDPNHAKKLITEIRPDFVKLDVQALENLETTATHDDIRQILSLTQATGGSVIAEAVETEAAYAQLKSLGIGLFQGYLFSAPAPL